jgi:hypothetical protein
VSLVERPRYVERQLVDAGSLHAEQAYLVAMRRLHDGRAHDWGIVSGLDVEVQPGGLVVEPGVAIDGFGRSLVVSQPLTIPHASLAEVGEAVDVWLLYGRRAGEPPRRGRWDCGPGHHGRWQEDPCIRLMPAATFHAEPDASSSVWPVFLGRAQRNEVGTARRRFAGLIGEQVVHPARAAAVRIGGASGGFALETPDKSGKLREQLTISADGATTVRGATTVDDAVAVGRRLEPKPIEPPAAASPWSVYRTKARQLRIEIGHPGKKGDPARYRLVVGRRRRDGHFARWLSVSANRVVEIEGALRVNGLIVQGPAPADSHNERFVAAAVAARLHGIKAVTEGAA